MKVCVLGSGSSGNSTFVEHQSTRLLVDAGLRAKEIVERLARIQVDPSTLDGIFISHEHHDHIGGAGPLARKFKIPIYISPRALDHTSSALQHLNHVPIGADLPLQIGSITVTPFSTPHDSVDPLAFALRAGSSRACIVSDIGFIPETVRKRLRNSDLLVIESNHDLEMLRTGPYPWSLKQRVMSNYGHLSNEALAYFFSEHIDGFQRRIMLTHLSRQNNHPQIVYVSATRALEKKCRDAEIHISMQDEISEMLEL
ncbi:MBL fold metallo-hydrolase [bacterium]|nr:MBL fold metallo-hydrolase [bacterium]MCI0606213.1 MBL fold metallo-hydrolase [bacterium]